MKKILIIIIMLMSKNAFAQISTGGYLYAGSINKRTIIVDFVDVVNPSMTEREKLEMMQSVIDYLNLNGIKSKLGKRFKVSDPLSQERIQENVIDDRFDAEFMLWRARYLKQKQKNHIIHVIAPAYHSGVKFDDAGWPSGGKLKLSGRAGSNLKRGCISYANASAIQIGGESLLKESFTSTIHELMHCMGAKHNDSVENMMHSAAATLAKYSSDKLPVLPETIFELALKLK